MSLKHPRLARGAALLTLLLAGCGGGLFVGSSTSDDQPPAVSLTVSVNTAAAGATVRLSAAAVDDNGVDQVAFFRVESSGSRTQLGIDTSEPYELDTVLPTDATGSVTFVARATDTANQSTDSATVSVTVK